MWGEYTFHLLKMLNTQANQKFIYFEIFVREGSTELCSCS